MISIGLTYVVVKHTERMGKHMSEGKYICKENKDAMVEALESAEEIIKRSRIISDPLKEPNYRLIVAQVAIALFNESNYTS